MYTLITRAHSSRMRTTCFDGRHPWPLANSTCFGSHQISVSVRVSQANKFKQFSSLGGGGGGGTLRLSSLNKYLVLETSLVYCFKLKRSVHMELKIVYLHNEYLDLCYR